MPVREFELIDRYFSGLGLQRPDLILGVGDDGAVLSPPPGQQLVQVLDTIVSGVHFPAGLDGRWVGHRALAVNLSDLAAMGAEPAWALLGLTLPQVDEAWVADFAAALDATAQRYQLAIAGGDTTSGPLAITVAATGFVPAGMALRRSGAQPGDRLWVSGTPGDAGAGLALLQAGGEQGAAGQYLRQRFLQPEPRVALGLALRGKASACIDISDGLLADLGHLCRASGVGAEVDAARLPLSAPLREVTGDDQALRHALGAGDDYELLFFAPVTATPALEALATEFSLSCIGQATASPGIRVTAAPELGELGHGFEHFGGPAASGG